MNHQIVRLHDLRIPLEEAARAEEAVRPLVARRLGLSPDTLAALRVTRRSLDARGRVPLLVCSVAITIERSLAERLLGSGRVEALPEADGTVLRLRAPPPGPRPVVVGAGPAGLLAALTLAEAGWPPVLLERGRPVESRARDVGRLYARGVLQEDSNVCYGEGGAGTFSDGKLMTRVNNPRVRRVLDLLVRHGARESILVDARPHLGTDRLVKLLKSLRLYLQDAGVDIRFATSLEGLEVNGGKLRALRLRGNERLVTQVAVVATGHSAHGVWKQLQAAGACLEARPFAVGFRVEHPQALINELRYGRAVSRIHLPAAEYRLTYNEEVGGQPRGVYSFCMCPGGMVVPTPTLPSELCLNGMSFSSRSGRYGNAALVVTVGPEDFQAAGHHGLFAGVRFQRACERAAYRAGGGLYAAPAARVPDFLAGRNVSPVGPSSYRRGLSAADLHALYPRGLIEALRRAFGVFEQKIPGFVTGEATLIGVETRTASPLRVRRGPDRQALGIEGLYPAGEGMGYGGGIVSAAIDGMASAEAILRAAGAEQQLLRRDPL